MCLVCKNLEKVAEKDIVCYKLVEKTKYRKIDENGGSIFDMPKNKFIKLLRPYVYLTPYRMSLIQKKCIKGYENFSTCDKPDAKFYSDVNAYEINGGYIHTYKNFEECFNYFDKLINNMLYKYEIYECIIPKGTKYWEGYIFNEVDEGYASKEIKFKKLAAKKKLKNGKYVSVRK